MGLTRVGIIGSVDLQIPTPGLKEHNSFIRQTFPWAYYAPALCGAPKYKSLALGLVGGQKRRQRLPEKVVTPKIRFPLDGKSKANLKN